MIDNNSINNFNYIKEEITEIKKNVNELKSKLDELKREFDINKLEQIRDKRDFEDSFDDNLRLVNTLNGTINELNKNIRDPETGLIVKLNKTVDRTNETLQSLKIINDNLTLLTKNYLDIKKDFDGMENRLKLVESKFETIKKYGSVIIVNLIGILIKFIWEFFKG
jgi:chromosome segregation ATPase